MNIEDDSANRKRIEAHLKAVDINHEELKNQQMSLENWVDKYIPLKIQHRIFETMEAVLDKKQRQKLADINHTLTDILRDEVLRDTGSSKLKQKVLDVITKLRVEAKVVEQY